jgi:hypothetical protein
MRIFLLTLLAGCSAGSNKCKDKTLFVSVTLDGPAQNADHIFVDVSVDGGTPVHTDLPHTAGKAMGGVQIEFPSGYPAGHSVAVTITALHGDATIASAQQSVSLANGCDTLLLTVSPPGPPDFASSSPDLTEVDSSELDLAYVDLATIPDLQMPDLTTFVDLHGCMPVAENCFNNTDDDCDGLIDCADPDCIGGASPQAVCVPDPGAFTAGTTVGSGSCPTAWPTSTTIHSGLNTTCDTGTCSCPNTNFQCGVELWSSSNGAACNGGSGLGFYTSDPGTCNGPLTFPSDGNYHYATVFYTGDCGMPAGTAAKNTPTWTNTEQFCSRATIGSGCTLGSVCVPSAANHCVMKAGAQSCPSNYSPRPTSYYLGFDDSSRQCKCNCSYDQFPCSGTPALSLHPDITGCFGTKDVDYAACSNTDLSSMHYAEGGGSITLDNSVCKPFETNATQTTLLNQQTVCCTP